MGTKKIAEFCDQSKASWCTDTGQVRSERSPSFKADLKGTDFVVTIDEGAEVNVVSQELVKKVGIKVVGTSKETTSADGSGMEVIGRTEKELVINGHFEGAKVQMNLGSVVVVKKLTAQLLLGEPGKKDNRVRTLPDEKKIEVRTKDGIYRTSYLNGKKKYDYSAMKVNKVVNIEPNELFELDIPEELLGTSKVMVNCMKGKEQWFLPQLRRVHNGKINIRNEMNEIVRVKGVFGEVWTCREVNLKEVR